MAEIRVSAERDIAGPPEQVYSYLADYERHHPHILPPNFSNFKVEEGGVGKGTVISFHLKVGTRERDGRMRVDEPEPGRVLTESDTNSSLVTRFTVTPQGAGSQVHIETVWQGAGGIGGFFERTFAPRILRRLYDDELNRLDQYSRQHAATGAS